MKSESTQEIVHNLTLYHYDQIKSQLYQLIEHKNRILQKQEQEQIALSDEWDQFRSYMQLYKAFQTATTQELTTILQQEQINGNQKFHIQCLKLDELYNQSIKMQSEFEHIRVLKETKNQAQDQIAKLEAHSARLLNEKQQLKERINKKENTKRALQFNISQHSKNLKQANQDIKEVENQKRYWNSLLQDAKGNVRVYCRIRPNLEENPTDIIQVNGECSLCLKIPEKLMKSGNYQKENYFNFEHIFNSDADQDDIYKELSDLVQSVVDGHNVCIFAYGQTGSGKTYTMQGNQNPKERGVIPRAIEQIFRETQSMTQLGWQLELRVGFQEIYNETIKDMISNQKCEEIKLFEVKEIVEVAQLFRKAMENRQVAATSSNEFSSRSHFIFQLNVQGSCQDKQINSTLNLVDLAGSERANVAKTEGDRFTETKNINKSLSALGDVFNALYNKHQFVPFRNSRLTGALQKYLEGTSKTLMMVTVTCKFDDFQQTLASLRFAEKVKSCKVQLQQNQQQQIKK